VSITGFLTRLRHPDQAPAVPGPVPARTCPTRALSRFLSALSARDGAVLLDLGSVVGSNVTFFGEQLGCKIFVEDLAADIDCHEREGRWHELPAFLERRFPQESGSVDGIICWDALDYLERPAAEAAARQLVRLLRPEGVLLAFFSHGIPEPSAVPTYTRHVVVDPRTLEHRHYAATRGKQRPVPNRDIQRMFEPLAITDQFLLKTNVREVVFRKPGA
jgi:hypothetical protein